MKKYYCAKIDATIFNYQSTNKAFFLDYDVNGFGKCRDLWIPKSICIIGTEPDENNYITLCIPMWFMIKNNIDYKRVTSVIWNYFPDELIKEM